MKTASLLLFFFVLLILSVEGFCQQLEIVDSTMVKDTTMKKNSFWKSKAIPITTVPVILFAGSAASWDARQDVRDLRDRYIPNFRHHYDDYLQYVPAVAVLGLNAAGVKGKNKIGRALVSYAFSAVILGATVNTIKYSAKVERPDGSSRNSFPSGHTANAFMNATFLHKEYGQFRSPLYSVAGYTIATATAVGRVLNNRHWVYDVLAGAGIGILSTDLGYVIADRIFKEHGEHIKLKNNPVPVYLKPSFIELRLGYAVATANDMPQKAHELYAKTGFNFGLEGACFFSRNVGLGAEFAFSSFPMNDDGINFEDEDVPLISNGHYTQPMGIRQLTAGPYFSLPLPENWFITGKITVGTALGAEGRIILKINDDYKDVFNTNELPYFRYKPESSFAWTTGIGIQKQVKRNIGIKAYMSYFDSDNDFNLDIIDAIDDKGIYSFKNIGSEKVKFNHLTFGLGLTTFLW